MEPISSYRQFTDDKLGYVFQTAADAINQFFIRGGDNAMASQGMANLAFSPLDEAWDSVQESRTKLQRLETEKADLDTRVAELTLSVKDLTAAKDLAEDKKAEVEARATAAEAERDAAQSSYDAICPVAIRPVVAKLKEQEIPLDSAVSGFLAHLILLSLAKTMDDSTIRQVDRYLTDTFTDTDYQLTALRSILSDFLRSLESCNGFEIDWPSRGTSFEDSRHERIEPNGGTVIQSVDLGCISKNGRILQQALVQTR